MDLRHVYIIACGGTIAGKGGSAADLTGYTAGELSLNDLIDAVPQLRDCAEISGEQFCNIDSSNMSEALWLKLAKRVNELGNDPGVDGIVITHGTDSLEETAYFLQLTAHTAKPVVLVGSMRPATALSADGPLNLLEAVQLAADANTGTYGVVVAMNGTICSARFVEKTDTTHVDTFKSRQQGMLGIIQDGKALWYQRPVRRYTTQSALSCDGMTVLPRVEIVYAYVGMTADQIYSAASRGVKAIVLAGFGHGQMPDDIAEALHQAAESGIIVVRASRTLGGAVTTVAKYADFISSDNLTPQKAKILVQLALLQTQKAAEIQKIFQFY